MKKARYILIKKPQSYEYIAYLSKPELIVGFVYNVSKKPFSGSEMFYLHNNDGMVAYTFFENQLTKYFKQIS